MLRNGQSEKLMKRNDPDQKQNPCLLPYEVGRVSRRTDRLAERESGDNSQHSGRRRRLEQRSLREDMLTKFV